MNTPSSSDNSVCFSSFLLLIHLLSLFLVFAIFFLLSVCMGERSAIYDTLNSSTRSILHSHYDYINCVLSTQNVSFKWDKSKNESTLLHFFLLFILCSFACVDGKISNWFHFNQMFYSHLPLSGYSVDFFFFPFPHFIPIFSVFYHRTPLIHSANG